MAARRPQHYATLLRIRKRQEDLKAQALAAARRGVGNAETQRAELEAQQRRALDDAASAASAAGAAGPVVDGPRVVQFLHYERHLGRLAVAKDAEIIGLEKVAEERRTELEETMKQRRIAERLVEGAERAVLEKAQKAELVLNDESASVRAALSMGRSKLGS